MNTKITKTGIASFLLGIMTLFVGLPSASAIITTFQSGAGGNYSGLTDTYVDYQGDPDANWGGRGLMIAYYRTGDTPDQKTSMLNFDMTSIASPVVVTSATLALGVYGNEERTGGYSQTYNLYAITRPGLNFGTSIGVPEDGAVSFSAAAYEPVSSVGWGTSNLGTHGPVPGEDYSNVLLGTFTLTDANFVSAYVYINLDPTIVTSWINSPGTNYGFVITAEMNPIHDQALFFSSENQYGSEAAPALIFEYTAVPEPGTTAMLGLAAALALGFHRPRRRQKLGSSL